MVGINVSDLITNNAYGADLSVLSVLYEEYKNSGRVILIDNKLLDAQELKCIISECRVYIGARTHSTIAVYSMQFPTLVLGYYVKSIGIAKDFFGTEENYVISVSKAKAGMELTQH